MAKHGVWHFVKDDDDPSKGWWCFDVEEYYVTIGMWPNNSSCVRDSLCARSYTLVRNFSGVISFSSATKFKTLFQAKRRSLRELKDRLQTSVDITTAAYLAVGTK